MAILHALGKFSDKQALTAGATDSANVIDLGALGVNGFGPASDVCLDIETNVKAAGSGTLQFDFLVSQEAALNTNLSVFRIYCAGITDPRVSAAGKKIYSGKISDQVWQLAKAGYRYLGIINTLGGSATITINAALTPGRPRTEDDVQVTVSPVGLPG